MYCRNTINTVFLSVVGIRGLWELGPLPIDSVEEQNFRAYSQFFKIFYTSSENGMKVATGRCTNIN